MSAEAITGIVALAIGALGALVGATWWMSSLYSEVRSIGGKLCEIHVTLQNDISSVRRVQDEHHHQIGRLQVRVGVLEKSTDECEE